MNSTFAHILPFAARFVLLPLLIVALVLLGLVYMYTRSRNPLAYPLVLLVIIPNVVVCIALIVHAHPSHDTFNCDIMHKAVHMLWMLKAALATVAAWIIYTWIVGDHIAPVEWNRRKTVHCGVFVLVVAVAVLLALVGAPWYQLQDGSACIVPSPRRSGTSLMLPLWLLAAAMLVLAFYKTLVAMSHTSRAWIHATGPLNSLRFGLVVVMVLIAVHLFLQTARYFIWTVLLLTLNARVYRQQSSQGTETFLTRVEFWTVEFDYFILWLDVVALLVLLVRLPQAHDFLALEKRSGWDRERQFRKKGPPPALVVSDTFVVKPSAAKDDVLFVAPPTPGATVTPTFKSWSPSDSKDAKLLGKDLQVPEAVVTRDKAAEDKVFEIEVPDEFSAFKRQSYTDQSNMFAAVSAMPSIEEHDDESMHDILMSDEEGGGGGGV